MKDPTVYTAPENITAAANVTFQTSYLDDGTDWQRLAVALAKVAYGYIRDKNYEDRNVIERLAKEIIQKDKEV